MPARPSSCFPRTHSPSLFISSRPVCPPCAVHLPPRPPCYRFCGNHIPETAALRVPCPVDASQYARLLSPSILRPSFVSSPHSPPPLTLLSPPPPPLTLLLPSAAAASASAGKRAASSSSAAAAAAAAAARRQMVAALGEGEWQRLLHLLGEAHAVAFGGHGGVRLPPLTPSGENEHAEMVPSGQAAAPALPPAAEAPRAAAGAAPLFTVQQSVLWPPACDAWEQTARDMGGSVPFEPRHVKQQASILANLARVGLLRPLPRPRTVERPATQTGAQAERGAVVQGDAQGGSTAGHVRGAEQAGAGGAGQQRGGEEAKEARPHAGAAAVQHGGEEAGRQGEEKGLAVPVKEGESRGDGAVDEEGEGEGGGEGEGRVYVELGAGRGYLTHMLCSCFHARHVVLVERRAYKFKHLVQGKERMEEQLKGSLFLLLRNRHAEWGWHACDILTPPFLPSFPLSQTHVLVTDLLLTLFLPLPLLSRPVPFLSLFFFLSFPISLLLSLLSYLSSPFSPFLSLFSFLSFPISLLLSLLSYLSSPFSPFLSLFSFLSFPISLLLSLLSYLSSPFSPFRVITALHICPTLPYLSLTPHFHSHSHLNSHFFSHSPHPPPCAPLPLPLSPFSSPLPPLSLYYSLFDLPISH
ncbi:unnamed protein product [Closterium sp. NIES-65]|nr:unnamed protein product [Closterium sp. NIES-65]